jgi:hypothetical protein
MKITLIATAGAIVAFLVGCASGQMAGVGYGMLVASGMIFVGMLIGD